MSLFFVPTQHPFVVDRRPRAQHYQHAHGGRCGSSMNSIQSPFDLMFAGQESRRDVPSYDVFKHDYEVIAEQRLRQHYAALQRQAELERERELRRRRIQHEQRRREAELAALAAAAAWQAEQERKQQRALVEQRRRREREIAAQQQRALERRQAAAAAQQQWEHFAVHGIAGAIELASRFFDAFNEDEDNEGKTSEPVATASITKPKDAEVQASDSSKDTEMHTVNEHAPIEQSVSVEHAKLQDQAHEKATQDSTQQKLVFSYPLPKEETQRTTIKADDIQVDFDAGTRTIQIKGLWDINDGSASDSHSTISAQSDDEDSTRGRKRSRSPKRSRVSDVDEKTGEEIVKVNDDDDFVEIPSTVAAGKQAQGTARITVPEDADISALRAELTDDGFRLYL